VWLKFILPRAAIGEDVVKTVMKITIP